ncbi:Oidioi.mRNA.OKI2018_I69.chr2.g4474.t1.cds [Oikopleura dioica]|uniref:Oidioi.mRNA.OKI2018_I69.chr2.g4474.t1.cds n=1 Tax=Oikopleura dioica TaxID=34765 RepID=A0ABN7T1Q9_OIKDI|nr:Oidioi.mRNA.OKI2018_I69.chr2.g4474.t1.cds [Oikopleura dioica]
MLSLKLNLLVHIGFSEKKKKNLRKFDRMRGWTKFTEEATSDFQACLIQLSSYVDGTIKTESELQKLAAGYVHFISGRDRSGRSLLALPNAHSNLENIDSKNWTEIIDYATRSSQAPYAVLIDRRSSNWSNVKEILATLQGSKIELSSILVLRPGGLQRIFSEATIRFVDLGFPERTNIKFLKNFEQVLPHIDPEFISTDIGGKNHCTVEFQLKCSERFCDFRIKVANFLDKVNIFVKKINQVEMPNDEHQCVVQKEAQNHQFLVMMDELLDSINEGDQLSDSVREICSAKYVAELENLLLKLKHLNSNLSAVWSSHSQRMDIACSFRKFEVSYRTIIVKLKAHEQKLSSTEYGLGTEWIEKLISLHRQYRVESQDTIKEAEILLDQAHEISIYLSDSVAPKCDDVKHLITRIEDSSEDRRSKLELGLAANRDMEAALDWWESASKILCRAASDAVQYSASFLEQKLEEGRKLKILNEDYDAFVRLQYSTRLAKNSEQVNELCEQYEKKILLVRIEEKPVPIAPVEPRIVVKNPKLQEISRDDSQAESSEYISTEESSEECNKSTDKLTSMRLNTSLSAVVMSSSASSLSADEDLLSPQKVDNVLSELLESEKIYIREIEEILQGYGEMIDSESFDCPEILRGKSHVLLGNLDVIFNFHSQTFLPQLQDAFPAPAKMARVFLDFIDDFDIYSVYCQNSAKAEQICQQLGVDNAFLKKCQNSLKHSLPITAFLLKPIQRITKYQLLLDQMVKCTSTTEDEAEIVQLALAKMLKCVRSVNDSLQNITGYSGAVFQLGKLIKFGQVEIETKRSRVRVSMRTITRFLFLYQESLLVCKKQENGNYSFKLELPLESLKINEEKTKMNRFSLMSAGGRYLMVSVINRETKMSWISQIKRALLNLDNLEMEKEDSYRQPSRRELMV